MRRRQSNRTRMLPFCLLSISAALFVVPIARSEPSRPAVQTQKHPGRKSYPSPDRRLRAVVISYPPAAYGSGESAVEVLDQRGRRIGYRDFRSEGSHGYQIAKIGWTRDSRFLIFSTTNSGGHQPWHFPTFFFDSRTRKFGDLDALSPGPGVAGPDFKLGAGSQVTIEGLEKRKRSLDLSRLTSEQLKSTLELMSSTWKTLQNK